MNPDPESLPPPLETPPAPEFAPPPAREQYPFWGYLDVFLLLALFLFLMLLVGAIFFFVPWRPQEVKAAAPVAMTFVVYGLWFLVLSGLIRLHYRRPFWPSLAWVRPPGGLRTAALWGLVVALICILLGVVLRPPDIKTPLEELLQDPASLVLVGVFAVTLGPLCEELAFRGLLLPLLARTFGAIAGVLLTALPFALAHGFEYAWSWQRLLIIFFAGAAFGWMRYRSGSTAAAAVMHSAYNLVFFVGLLAQRSGLVH